MIRPSCLAALMLAGTLAGAQQPTVVVRDAGPGPVGRYLADLLAQPATRIIIADTVRIPRDSTIDGPLVVIGRRAEIVGTVHGDAVVVGGDLFVKPRAVIEGQGMAIGGGAYPSLLAFVDDGLVSERDFTFDAVETTRGIELRYREQYVGMRRSLLDIATLSALRMPTYDRSNGLSLAAGPGLSVGAATLNLIATYRSQIGRVDPSLDARLDVSRKLWVEAFAGRESRSNEEWISSANSNTLNSIVSGRDERNWYRAVGGYATVNRLFETSTMTATYSIGGSFERASAARPGPSPTSGPWSLLDRTDTEAGMFRPNPQIPGGDITSALGGAAYRWTAGRIKARLDVDLEVPIAASFAQATATGRVEFPTFGLQKYRMELHAVTTAGDIPPGQRFAYLGGSGTLPTQDTLLTLGGDQLLFIESRYEIPVTQVKLPLAGSPTVTLRHIMGSAGLGGLPELTQIVGVRLSIPFVRAQWLMETASRKTKFSAGVSFSR